MRDLKAAEFVVREDGVVQVVSAFAAGEFPAAVAVALDRSVSMAGLPLAIAKAAARDFVAALEADDRTMLIGIGGEVQVLAPPAVDRAPLLRALEAMDAWSTTALFDALIATVGLLEPERGRRAIVVLSDGEDRYSKAQAADVVERVRQSDVLVYPIAMGKALPPLFTELATLSGGRAFHLRNPKQLTSTLQTIAEDLRFQYLLGYQPAQAWVDGPAWRRLSVTLQRPGLRVRARSGYTTH